MSRSWCTRISYNITACLFWQVARVFRFEHHSDIKKDTYIVDIICPTNCPFCLRYSYKSSHKKKRFEWMLLVRSFVAVQCCSTGARISHDHIYHIHRIGRIARLALHGALFRSELGCLSTFGSGDKAARWVLVTRKHRSTVLMHESLWFSRHKLTNWSLIFVVSYIESLFCRVY